jgi:UDP-2,3-diacylglucosamine hydrolase
MSADEMTDVTLFISDLHLCAERPAITALFLEFLKAEARQARALYILGDLFEYWIGDDAVDVDGYRPILTALHELTIADVPLYVIPGNRDFLMGQDFERASGAHLLPDPTPIDLYGVRTLIMHGDSLCTRDVEHMQFRALTRDPTWQRETLTKPLAERQALARRYREMSRTSTAGKELEIMDVTPSAVDDVMRANDVQHLIHGHTHRPAQHVFSLDGKRAVRTVLGDWYEQGSVLRVTANSQKLERLA